MDAPVAALPALVAPKAPPRRLFRARGEFCATPATANNFTKGVRVSPDGLCLLSSSDDRVLRVFEVAGDAADTAADDAQSVLQMREGGTVYDAAWYPFMTSQDPGTCIFISTSRDQPVHMWDAYTGGVSDWTRRLIVQITRSLMRASPCCGLL